MKKITLILLCTLIGSLSAKAQETSAIQDLILNASRGEVASSDLIRKADREKNDLQAQIDLVLNQLLATPFEMRQYVFPALFDIPSVPKKIRTHPEIAIWEGKLPTDIAPQVQEYARQYLWQRHALPGPGGGGGGLGRS